MGGKQRYLLQAHGLLGARNPIMTVLSHRVTRYVKTVPVPVSRLSKGKTLLYGKESARGINSRTITQLRLRLTGSQPLDMCGTVQPCYGLVTRTDG